jgi:hypothetical protein
MALAWLMAWRAGSLDETPALSFDREVMNLSFGLTTC